MVLFNSAPTSNSGSSFNGNYRSSVNGGVIAVACSCQVNSGTVIFINGNSLSDDKVVCHGGFLAGF
jgi:hypothetical protein